MGIWKNFRVKVRHNRGEEDKFNAFVENYDAVMEAINNVDQTEKDNLKEELNSVIDGNAVGDAMF